MAINNINLFPIKLSLGYSKAILPTNTEFRKDLNNFTPTASDTGNYFMHCGNDNGNFIPGHIYKVCKTAHKFIADDGIHVMYLRDNAAYYKFLSKADGDLEFDETWFNVVIDGDEMYRIPDANPCVITVGDDGKRLFSRNSYVYYGFLFDTEEVEEISEDLPFGEYGFVEVTHEGLEYIGSKIEIDPSILEKTKLGNDVTFSEFIKAINNGGSLGTVFVSEKHATISVDESDLTERVYVKSLLPAGTVKLVSNIRFKVNDTFGYGYSYEIPTEMLETGECVFDIKIEQADCYGEALFELHSDEGVIASYSFKVAFDSSILTSGLAPHGTYWAQNLNSSSFNIEDFVDNADTRRITDNFRKINVRFAESDTAHNRMIFIPLPSMGDDGIDIPNEAIGVKVTDGNGLDLTGEFAPFIMDVPISGGNYGDTQRPVVVAISLHPIGGESPVTIEIFDKRLAANYDNLPPEGTKLADGDSLYIVEMRNIETSSLPDSYIEIYCLDNGAKFSYAPGNTFNSLTGYFRAIV